MPADISDVSEADEALFEIIESDRLVFFTGAGSSAGLLNVPGNPFPGWLDLLDTVRKEREKRGAPIHGEKLLDLFLVKGADGPTLIEAASILREGFEADFDRIASELLTPAPDAAQGEERLSRHHQKQDLLLSLHPRGVVTVNVDELHERHLKLRSMWEKWNFADPLQPGGDRDLRKALIEIDEKRFLIKAHGTCGQHIAFDFKMYRRLLSELPIYQTFMMNLFTNFRIVFFGFGLSDLDFDFLLQTQSLTFGDPIRRHVALVRHQDNDALIRRAAVLSKRFGILYRWYREHSEITDILEQAAKTPGKKLRSVIDQCLDRDDLVRRRGHLDLANLGPAGKHVAVLSICEEIRRRLPGTDSDWFPLSELIYTLGKISPPLEEDRRNCRKILLQILQETKLKEIAAHAILALDKFAEDSDVAPLQELYVHSFWEGLQDPPDASDPDGRIPVYLQSLIFRLRAKIREKKAASSGMPSL